jgi:hypothetical protein
MKKQLDKIIQTALKELDAYLKKSDWHGRENEVVNLFVHAFLAKHLAMSRVGIEVSVKQLSGPGRKGLVRKDLVIWGKENGTVWNGKREPVNVPFAVLEWKVDDERKCAGDIAWLKKFTKEYPGVTGYSICAFIKGKRGVCWVKVKRGVVMRKNLCRNSVF